MSHTEERYLRAATSSHLQANEYSDDIDSVIAAGSAREGLAMSLLRLRGEYDAVRGENDQQQRIAQACEAEARRLEQIALVEVSKMNRGPTRAQHFRRLAAEVRKAAADEALTAHALILVRLKTLRGAKLLLWYFTRDEAERRELGATDSEVVALTSKLLQAFLAPKCSACGGRGFNGGHRQPTVHCTACRQSGAMAIEWGKIEFEQFGRDLLYLIEEKVGKARGWMSQRTRRD